mmetsp:Transcript_40113/g.62650  ORF Transcript_40113/g.62650 Transcript_40113/m.62650 type:complete len:150 (-) Transcript_40113:1679-2128(-)
MMAGLYDHWYPPEAELKEERVTSCTIITTDVNQQLGWLHDRMPAVIEPSDVDAWLDAEKYPFESPEVQKILSPYNGSLHLYEVGDVVNSIRNNNPECLLPLASFRLEAKPQTLAPTRGSTLLLHKHYTKRSSPGTSHHCCESISLFLTP